MLKGRRLLGRKAAAGVHVLHSHSAGQNLSDGKPHKKRAWKWLRGELYVFGGGTRAKELYEGWYEDPETGERVDDLSRKYFVALPRPEVERLRDILRQACGVFAQKCIYLSVAGRVEFVEGPADEGP